MKLKQSVKKKNQMEIGIKHNRRVDVAKVCIREIKELAMEFS